MEINRMGIKEFRSFGFLQEANRLFFHPLGLALEVIIDDETGAETLGGIWDYRDDPEGMMYASEDIDLEKASSVRNLLISKSVTRMNLFRNDTPYQPLPEENNERKTI